MNLQRFICGGLLCLMIAACGKSKNPSGAVLPPAGGTAQAPGAEGSGALAADTQAGARSSDRVTPPAERPEYVIPDELRETYPEIAAFVRRFMETCLAGDYRGYRGLVSRQRAPETRERFQRIFHAIKLVQVLSIREVGIQELPPPVYLVISDVEFRPDADKRVELRQRERQIAILVFKEENEWRMLPAPSALQPRSAPVEETDDAGPPLPPYPWDEDVDY